MSEMGHKHAFRAAALMSASLPISRPWQNEFNATLRANWRPEQMQQNALPKANSNYSITSSAMATSPGGKVSPSDLATLRLISNSNLADCTTGRSVGCAPRKILPL